MMEAEDRAGNIAVRAELAKFRGSLAAGSAATYTLGSSELFNLSQGGEVIGQLQLKYKEPFNNREEGGNGWFGIPDRRTSRRVAISTGSTSRAPRFAATPCADGAPYMAWFEGTISGDGSSITNMTFNWWTFGDSGTETGLSAGRTRYEPANVAFNPGPIFAGTVSPRDMLPQFDPNGEPIPGTFGHGLNNDATLGGILPGFTQQTWMPTGFEVWATNTNYLNDPRRW